VERLEGQVSALNISLRDVIRIADEYKDERDRLEGDLRVLQEAADYLTENVARNQYATSESVRHRIEDHIRLQGEVSVLQNEVHVSKESLDSLYADNSLLEPRTVVTLAMHKKLTSDHYVTKEKVRHHLYCAYHLTTPCVGGQARRNHRHDPQHPSCDPNSTPFFVALICTSCRWWSSSKIPRQWKSGMVRWHLY